MNTNELRAIVAQNILQLWVESAARTIKRQLGYPVRPMDYRVSETVLSSKDQTPRFVRSIEIHGSVCDDMYDDHPGHTYYWHDNYRCLDTATGYETLGMAKQQAELLLATTIAENESRQDDPEYAGQFVAKFFLIKDQFGEVLLRGHRACDLIEWDVPSDSGLAVLLQQAAALESEASEEARWDNFDTANRLRNQADRLRQLVQSSQLARLTVQ